MIYRRIFPSSAWVAPLTLSLLCGCRFPLPYGVPYFGNAAQSGDQNPMGVSYPSAWPSQSGSLMAHQPQPEADPGYLQNGPTLGGNRLGLQPGETATERALALSHSLEQAEEEKEELEQAIRELEAVVDQSKQAVGLATQEVMTTKAELARTRTELSQWQQEMLNLRAKLRDADRAKLEVLQNTASFLRQLAGPEGQPGGLPKPQVQPEVLPGPQGESEKQPQAPGTTQPESAWRPTRRARSNISMIDRMGGSASGHVVEVLGP